KAKARRATGLRVARLTCGVRSGIRCRHLRNAFADVLRTRGLICNNLRVNADTQKCGLDPDSQFVELAVEVFGLLADATRVRIILALRGGQELSVNHLADIVNKSPAAVSQHLAKLRMARILATRQEGQRVFYRLENEHASQLVSDAIFQAEHSVANGQVPAHHHDERAEE